MPTPRTPLGKTCRLTAAGVLTRFGDRFLLGFKLSLHLIGPVALDILLNRHANVIAQIPADAALDKQLQLALLCRSSSYGWEIFLQWYPLSFCIYVLNLLS